MKNEQPTRRSSTSILSQADLANLRQHAAEVRQLIIRMVTNAQSGHVGGSLSATDLLVTLFYHVMNHNPADPHWADRDRFVLSKGHCSPVLYALLAKCGYFPVEDLDTFRRPGSHLQGHPCSAKTPGVEASTGTLGLGLPTACGMALAAKLRKQKHWVYVLCGDGESQEGQIWEAAMFGAKYHLNNVIAFTDRNRLQTDGDTENVMPLDPLDEKWKGFGWQVQEINGHDMEEIVQAIEVAKSQPEHPHMILLNTIKGKGVSFMENISKWHGTPPTTNECARAMEELSHEV